jgi:hypothetical protein
MRWTRLGSCGAVLVLAAGSTWLLGPGHAAPAAAAGRLLDAAVLPRGAVQVPALPGQVFAQPSEEPACDPLTDAVRYWTVPGGPAQAAAFLQTHAPAGLTNDGTGSLLSTSSGETVSYDVTDAPPGRGFGSPAGLDFTVAALPDGMTGIRADAELVPANANCAFSAGPDVPAP